MQHWCKSKEKVCIGDLLYENYLKTGLSFLISKGWDNILVKENILILHSIGTSITFASWKAKGISRYKLFQKTGKVEGFPPSMNMYYTYLIHCSHHREHRNLQFSCWERVDYVGFLYLRFNHHGRGADPPWT